MPTYDYQCNGCGHVFELFQQMSAQPIKKCPKCKKDKLKRLIGSGIGIIFKGSGFYETDYKRKEQKSRTNSSSLKGSQNKNPAENKEKTKIQTSQTQKSSDSKKTEKSENTAKSEKSKKPEKKD